MKCSAIKKIVIIVEVAVSGYADIWFQYVFIVEMIITIVFALTELCLAQTVLVSAVLSIWLMALIIAEYGCKDSNPTDKDHFGPLCTPCIPVSKPVYDIWATSGLNNSCQNPSMPQFMDSGTQLVRSSPEQLGKTWVVWQHI